MHTHYTVTRTQDQETLQHHTHYTVTRTQDQETLQHHTHYTVTRTQDQETLQHPVSISTCSTGGSSPTNRAAAEGLVDSIDAGGCSRAGGGGAVVPVNLAQVSTVACENGWQSDSKALNWLTKNRHKKRTQTRQKKMHGCSTDSLGLLRSRLIENVNRALTHPTMTDLLISPPLPLLHLHLLAVEDLCLQIYACGAIL